MTTERQIETKACNQLRLEFNAVCIKFGSHYDRSWPDRSINLRNGLHFYIEFKVIGRSLTKLLAQRIKELRANGHAVYVCRSVEEAIWSAQHYTQAHLSGAEYVFQLLGIDWRRDKIQRRDAECAGITLNEIASYKWLDVV